MIKVIGWFMIDYPHNITADPAIVADWHRKLFRVAPLYHVDSDSKQRITDMLEDCYLQADDGENYVYLPSSVIDILQPLVS